MVKIRLTDEFLKENGIDRVYRNKRDDERYITSEFDDTFEDDDMITIFSNSDDTGKSDKKISFKEFKENFIDITDDFYSHLRG